MLGPKACPYLEAPLYTYTVPVPLQIVELGLWTVLNDELHENGYKRLDFTESTSAKNPSGKCVLQNLWMMPNCLFECHQIVF